MKFTAVTVGIVVVVALLLMACTIGTTETSTDALTETADELPTAAEVRPRHTAIEVLEAAQALEPVMGNCDGRFREFTLEPPRYSQTLDAWILGCTLTSTSGGVSSFTACFTVDDRTLVVDATRLDCD